MSYITDYTKDDKTTKFVEQSDVMIDIAMASNMKEVRDIVKQWKKDLKSVDEYRRANTDTSSSRV